MKSIKQQYIDLQEGNLSQANFMRNLRMTMPQYVTNVTSFEDSVRILKNKGILTEADTEGKYKKVTGKDLYGSFKEVDNLNGQEVLIGIDYEIEKDHELTKEEATKIVIKNLKKNPIYYTSALMSGKEGYEPEYIGGKSAQPEAHQMQYLEKNMGNIVDKKRGMQPVKDVEKVKKDSDKGGETNKMEKGVSLMSLVAKSTRGVQKMDATGEKMKKVTVKENKVASTIFDKNANITKGITDIAKGKDDKKKLTKERLMQMIQEELAEMFDGRDNMTNVTGLDEDRITKTPWGGSISSKDEAYDDKREWVEALFRIHPQIKENPTDYMKENEKGDISVSRGLEVFGSWYNGKGFYPEKYGVVYSRRDISNLVYPPGSRMDETLNETKLFADFSMDSDSDIESRFARSISEVAREYDHLDNIEISRFFDEYEDGDDVYAGPMESLRFFQTLPEEFIVTNNMNNVDESFMITKTGNNSFIAEEI